MQAWHAEQEITPVLQDHFIIPSKHTGVSVRVTLINSLEVKAAVLSAA